MKNRVSRGEWEKEISSEEEKMKSVRHRQSSRGGSHYTPGDKEGQRYPRHSLYFVSLNKTEIASVVFYKGSVPHFITIMIEKRSRVR